MFRLPISGLNVGIQLPAGGDDLVLLEAPEADTCLALKLLARLSAPGAEWSWETLPAGDLEAALLHLRRMVFGDTIRASAICPSKNCRKPVDVSFRISDFLKHHAPRMPASVVEGEDPGWWRLRGAEIRFRIPSVADRAAVHGSAQPAAELRRLCIQPAGLPSRLSQRVERALTSLAPILSGTLRGRCPECLSTAEISFDVESFVLIELRNQAGYLYRDVHLLAKHYHWQEQVILALPRYRRLQYAELLLEEGSQG